MRAGNVLIVLGLLLLVVGLIVRFAPSGLFSWFGNLPGDVRIEGERTRVYIPITSMLLVSLILSVVLNLIARFFRGE